MFDTLVMIRKNHDLYSPALMKMYNFLNKNGVDVSFDTFQEAYVKSRDELYAKANANLEEPHFNIRVSETLKSLGYNYGISSSLVKEASEEFCNEFMTFVYLDKDAEALLRGLHRKYKLGIISNFAIPECVDKLLKAHRLVSLLDAVVVSGAINKRKPSPEIFMRTLQALGVGASETVFVGDTLDADVEGAKAVGMKSVYVQRRVEKEVENVHPDIVIKNLSELPLVLQDL
jgi:putative hydrolase of the HAD superfamily